MFTELLICAMTLGVPAQENTDTYEETENVSFTENIDESFWAKRKTLRIGYQTYTFQNESAVEMPMKFGVGLSNVNNVWFHKKPIAGMIKFAFDHGFSANYGMFDTNIDDEGYTGPSGYIGNAPATDPDDNEMPFDLSKIGMHHLSVGYALGASLTVNPVAKLRLNGYFHFVPSCAVIVSGSTFSVGFMPYCRYGAEVSYGRVGVGIEWGSGMSNMSDMMSKLMAMGDEEAQAVASTPKTRYYSNYMNIYLALKFGKNRRK